MRTGAFLAIPGAAGGLVGSSGAARAEVPFDSSSPAGPFSIPLSSPITPTHLILDPNAQAGSLADAKEPVIVLVENLPATFAVFGTMGNLITLTLTAFLPGSISAILQTNTFTPPAETGLLRISAQTG